MQNLALWIMFPNLRDCGEMSFFLGFFFQILVLFFFFSVKTYQFLALYFASIKLSKSGSFIVYKLFLS